MFDSFLDIIESNALIVEQFVTVIFVSSGNTGIPSCNLVTITEIQKCAVDEQINKAQRHMLLQQNNR